jgi:hypothetical protein
VTSSGDAPHCIDCRGPAYGLRAACWSLDAGFAASRPDYFPGSVDLPAASRVETSNKSTTSQVAHPASMVATRAGRNRSRRRIGDSTTSRIPFGRVGRCLLARKMSHRISRELGNCTDYWVRKSCSARMVTETMRFETCGLRRRAIASPQFRIPFGLNDVQRLSSATITISAITCR